MIVGKYLEMKMVKFKKTKQNSQVALRLWQIKSIQWVSDLDYTQMLVI
jgi:hypothetical protein